MNSFPVVGILLEDLLEILDGLQVVTSLVIGDAQFKRETLRRRGLVLHAFDLHDFLPPLIQVGDEEIFIAIVVVITDANTYSFPSAACARLAAVCLS